MRKLFTVVIFLFGALALLSFANPSPAYAADQACCPSGYRYCAPQNNCQQTTVCNTTNPSTLLNCSETETCSANPANPAGTCTAAADDGDGDGGGAGESDTLPPPKKEINIGFITLSTDPATLAGQILEFGFGVGALLTVLLLIIGGYEVATSAGNPDQLDAAKKRITAAISGLVFLLAAGIILRTMGGLVGIEFFK